MQAKRAKQGVRGLALGEIFMTTPLRSLENAPFFENLHLKEAMITTDETLSRKVLKCLSSVKFWIDSGTASSDMYEFEFSFL